MARQSFSSFKELLIKKDLQSENEKREVRYDVLTRIFRHVPEVLVKNNLQHFDKASQDHILSIYQKEAFTQEDSKLSNGEYEAIVSEHLSSISDSEKLKMIDLLEEEVDIAIKNEKRIAKLAKKYEPKDPTEELENLKGRIKEIQQDIIEIEMNMMTLEKDELTKLPRYKNLKNARDRRKALIGKLEKQISGLQKKLGGSKKSTSK